MYIVFNLWEKAFLNWVFLNRHVIVLFKCAFSDFQSISIPNYQLFLTS